MRAIEINSKTDKSGHLKLDYQLGKSEQNVRILILVDENTYPEEDEKLWLNTIAKSPAFNFLNEPEEDIYSLKDGEPLND